LKTLQEQVELDLWSSGLARTERAGPVKIQAADAVTKLTNLLTSWKEISTKAVHKVLSQAVTAGYADLVKRFCEANPEDARKVLEAMIPDEGGNVLFTAARKGDHAMLQVLLDLGIDPHVEDNVARTALDVAVAILRGLDPEDEACEKLKATAELLQAAGVRSNFYAYYQKDGVWLERPPQLDQLILFLDALSNFYGEDYLSVAFKEIDANHSGAIVKYEWAATFDCEGPLKEALISSGLESDELFSLLDTYDDQGKDMAIGRSAFELLNDLDYSVTSEVWQNLLLAPLVERKANVMEETKKKRRSSVRQTIPLANPPPRQ